MRFSQLSPVRHIQIDVERLARLALGAVSDLSGRQHVALQRLLDKRLRDLLGNRFFAGAVRDLRELRDQSLTELRASRPTRWIARLALLELPAGLVAGRKLAISPSITRLFLPLRRHKHPPLKFRVHGLRLLLERAGRRQSARAIPVLRAASLFFVACSPNNRARPSAAPAACAPQRSPQTSWRFLY